MYSRRWWMAAVVLVVVSCVKPNLLRQEGQRYAFTDWKGGLFVFLAYTWEGGAFDDAVALQRRFVRWGGEVGMVVLPVGRFPTTRTWQLGFMSSRAPGRARFEGYLVDTMTVPGGSYARMMARGHIENLYRYWKPFKRWVLRDGYTVDSPVFEVYTGMLSDSLAAEDRIGELRYRVLPLSRLAPAHTSRPQSARND